MSDELRALAAEQATVAFAAALASCPYPSGPGRKAFVVKLYLEALRAFADVSPSLAPEALPRPGVSFIAKTHPED